VKVPGSVLELMFSDGWEERVDRDKDGYVFLDHDPFLFEIVLRHLVALQTYGIEGEHLKLRPVPSHLEEEFRLMLKFMGLEDLVQPAFDFKWSTALKTPTVRLTSGNSVAVSEGNGNLRHHAMSDNVFQSGIFKFDVFVEFLEEWAMIGVIREEARLGAADDACSDGSVYGWGSDGKVFVKGKECSRKGYPARAFKTEDRLSLTLDCRCSCLTLTAKIGDDDVDYKIPNLEGNKWRVLVATYYGVSVIEIRAT